MNIYLKIFFWILGIGAALILSLILFFAFRTKNVKIFPAKNGLTIVDPALNDTVFGYLSKNMRNKANVSIGIINEDSVKFIGVTRENDELKNVDLADSIFQIGSISKVFTTSILAKMVTDGDLKLDESIDKYLGFPLHNDLKITFKSLANHTSGMDRMPEGSLKNIILNPENPYKSLTNEWMENYLKSKLKVDEKKIGSSEYSNLGVSILGYTLAKINGSSYTTLYEKYIFSAHDMKNSFITQLNNDTKIINAYDNKNEIAPKWSLQSMSPAGGIASNMKDMINFAKAQMEIKDNPYTLAHSPTVKLSDTMSCGLAWMIIKDDDNNELLWHNGAVGTNGGYTSSIIINKKAKKAVIILSSIHHDDAGRQLDKLGKALLKI
ncbi:MAG: beta-lactamase family protein [Saprospiraceae bacterium]|nr:beta-lactamase family protein [Saprospiraceae bacterium]